MPLARIITRSPEETVAVSDYLLSLGYNVETISPGEFRVTPADFELNLDHCRAGEVMHRAKMLLEAHLAAAATAAPAPEPQPDQPQRPKIALAYDIAGRPVEFGEEELPERRGGPSSLGRALVSMLQRAGRGMAAGISRTAESLGARNRDFQQRRAGAKARALEAEQAREREQMLQEEQRARERVRREIEAQRLIAGQEELRRQQRMAAEKAEEHKRMAAEKAAADARERARIEAEHVAAMAAEQEKLRFEAKQQAAIQAEREREAARHEAMIAAQREAEKQKLELPTTMLLAQEYPPAPAAPEPRTISAPPLESAANLAETTPVLEPPATNRAQVYRRSQPLRRRTPIRISRIELATAAAAALILGLGIFGYTVRRPASPLSPGELMKGSSVKQQVPFGAATIAPPAATPRSSPVTAAAAGKSSAASRSATKTPPKRTTARRLRRAAKDEPVAEDEVVVRHLQTPRPKQQSTTSSSGLKQYSDMN